MVKEVLLMPPANGAGAATSDLATPSPCKRLKFQPPDVIVTVGSGDKKREFECYAVVLCFASIVFDTMLSVDMKEKATLPHPIALPDKDPQEWELFYSFIDPSINRKAKIGKPTARILLPWFHEYQMEDMVLKCDEALSKVELQTKSRDWLPTSDTRNTRERILRERLEFLALSSIYDLPKTQQTSTKIVSLVIKHSHDLVDLDLIKTAISINSENKNLIWDYLKGLIPNLDKNPDDYAGNELLPHLILAALEKRTKGAAALKATKEAASAEKKLRCVVKSVQEAVEGFPSSLYQALPNRKTTTNGKVNAEGE